MNVLRVKPGVQFTIIAEGGFRILSALDQTTQQLTMDLMITSGCDGEHSGPNDPHHRGEAYDWRSHDFNAEEKLRILQCVTEILGDRFYVFLESPGTPNEHFHGQVRKGTTYP